jgi:hypothetical protein
MAGSLAEQTRELLQAVSSLTERVESVDQQLEKVNEDIYASVRRIKMIVAGLVVGGLISLSAIGYAIYNSNKIDTVQRRTSNEVLCPLYKLFLDSYNPSAQPPEKRQAYEDAFNVIKRSYDVLNCPAQQ